MNITDKQADYASNRVKKLQDLGFRAKSDLRNEKIGFKIREHTIQKVPYILVVGDKEVESRTVAVRARGGKDLGSISLDELASILAEGVAARSRAISES